MEKSITIPGLDIAKGIAEQEGNRENYFKVLRSFMVSTKTKLSIMENTSIDDLKNYEITVHGIKGTSRTICAESIGKKAAELEKAAEAGDIDFINKHNPSFLKDLNKLLNDLGEMFNNMDSKIIKQQKDKPDMKILQKLLEACEIYDMMEVEAAMIEISKYKYDSDDGLAEWLQDCAESMQYDQIVKKINSLLK